MMSRKVRGKMRSGKTTQKKRRRKAAPKKQASKRVSRSRRVFRQCLLCGAQVDEMYGTGDTSWCPHCREPEWVIEKIGELPDPRLYGGWVLEQEEIKRKESAVGNLPSWKYRKPYTGTYTCLKCHSEFNLLAAETLRCHECGGFLIWGALGYLWKNQNG